MIKSFGQNDPKVISYALEVFSPEDPILREIRERCDREGLPDIQVGDMDALHLEVLTRAFGAKKIVEIGTLGGYSGVSLLRGTSGGKLWTFEVDSKRAEIAEESFRKAGFGDNAKVLVGPAIENLGKIEKEGPFDLVFIDADKENYPRYLEWAVENLRVGGAVLGDNTFAWGMIADTKFKAFDDERAAKALREFNHEISHHPRMRATVLPTGEGLTLGVKIK